MSRDQPDAAARVMAAIVKTVYRLQDLPLLGRVGKIVGTRELIVPGLPYIVPYRIVKDEIRILSVLHTSQKWPEKL